MTSRHFKLVGGTDVEKRQASESTFNQRVGSVLREARVKKGMTLDAMGRFLFIDSASVKRHEDGTTPLTVVRAARMCQVLGVDIRELF